MLELTVREPGPLEARTSEEQTVICFAALIAGLQKVVHGSDQWWLAHNSAKRMVGELGVPPEVYEGVMHKLEDVRKARNANDPMARAFAT